MKTSLDQLHRFFADFYSAAATSSLEKLLAATSELLGRPRMGVTLTQRDTLKRLATAGVGSPEARVREYRRYYESKDVLFDRAQRIAPNVLLHRDSIIAWSEFEKSVVYNEFHRPVGIEDIYALAVDEGPVRMVVLSFQNVGEHPIEADEVRAFAELAPHFQTALRLRLRSSAAAGSGLSWSPQALRQAFGLTPSEARVALMLCSGLPTKDIVDQLQLRPDSVRSQLKSVFAKTDTHSQIELVHMLLSTIRAH